MSNTTLVLQTELAYFHNLPSTIISPSPQNPVIYYTSLQNKIEHKKKNKQKITNHLTYDTANIQINALSI